MTMTMNERDEGRRLKYDDTMTNKDHENYDDGGDERRKITRGGEKPRGRKTTHEDAAKMGRTNKDDE